MRIWIDLCNSPHVSFFAGLVRDLGRTHSIVLTCRPLANTVELARQHGLVYHVVGRHYGRSKARKTAGLPVRVWQLYSFLRRAGIDAAISHSSFYSPIVARLLGARCIYLNDNEHALGNRISFPFADEIMVPEHLSIRTVRRHGARGAKITRFPGVKEGVYLWDSASAPPQAQRLVRRDGTRLILLRPEPWAAQYYNGRANFLDRLMIDLKDKATVVVLPRGQMQAEHYRQAAFDGVVLPRRPVNLRDAAGSCDLFIGAGGTMTREAALLGIPTISAYQDELLEVDKHLIRRGLMVHAPAPTAGFVSGYLAGAARRPPDADLLQKGRVAYGLIRNALLGNGHRQGGGQN